jgi:hypothetical protein
MNNNDSNIMWALRGFVSVAFIVGTFVACANIKESPAARVSREATEARVRCYERLRSTLKDPGSLRIYNRGSDSMMIDYSATNSFGGRLRKQYWCSR